MTEMNVLITKGLILLCLCFNGTLGLSCPSGFEVHGNSCYFFSHGKETWVGAYDSCKLFDAKLVEVNDSFENYYLARKTAVLHDDWWIGLTDKLIIGEYMWSSSLTRLASGDFTDWGQDEPGTHFNENCIFYSSFRGNKWADDSCTLIKHYICEIDESANSVSVIG